MVQSVLVRSMCKGPEAGRSIEHTFRKQREVSLAEGPRRSREDDAM